MYLKGKLKYFYLLRTLTGIYFLHLIGYKKVVTQISVRKYIALNITIPSQVCDAFLVVICSRLDKR